MTKSYLMRKKLIPVSSPLITSNDGAKAMLDQLPTITPNASAIANQYRVEPPQINIQINGKSVVALVYRVLVIVEDTALSI